MEVKEDDDLSENAMDFGNEPEVAKVIHPLTRRISVRNNAAQTFVRDEQEGAGNKEGDDKGGTLMTDEYKEREKGSVDRQVYITWAKAGGGISIAVAILIMFIIVEALTVASKWWLTHWSESGVSNPFFFLSIYALINFSAIVATFFRLLFFMLAGLRASRSMFERLLDVVLLAPMSFFDT